MSGTPTLDAADPRCPTRGLISGLVVPAEDRLNPRDLGPAFVTVDPDPQSGTLDPVDFLAWWRRPRTRTSWG